MRWFAVVDRVSEILGKAVSEGRAALLEPEALRVCALYGIPVAGFKLAETVEEAVTVSEEMGFPVVLKAVSPDILHKSDVGGVVVDLKSPQEVRTAYGAIVENVAKHRPGARVLGVLVQEMASPSLEAVVGMTKDPTFGPALMFGLGGVFVEVLRDVSFRIAPITEEDAWEMVREIRAFEVLRGVRGRGPSDIRALVEILLKVSQLVVEHGEIDQLDLNPIFVYGEGAVVVDARILLAGGLWGR